MLSAKTEYDFLWFLNFSLNFQDLNFPPRFPPFNGIVLYLPHCVNNETYNFCDAVCAGLQVSIKGNVCNFKGDPLLKKRIGMPDSQWYFLNVYLIKFFLYPQIIFLETRSRIGMPSRPASIWTLKCVSIFLSFFSLYNNKIKQ